MIDRTSLQDRITGLQQELERLKVNAPEMLNVDINARLRSISINVNRLGQNLLDGHVTVEVPRATG